MKKSSIFASFMLSALSASGIISAHGAEKTLPPLQTAFTSDRIMNAVTVSDDGRVFVSFPYWGGGEKPGPSVTELEKDGTPHAFPDQSWNDWNTTKDADHSFVRVNAIRMGPDGNLWVVDSGEANVGGKPNAPDGAKPKLVVIDIKTAKVVKIISLALTSTPHTYVDDLRFHGSMLYLTDAGDPGLIVVNEKTGTQRRVLEKIPATTDLRPMYAQGKVMVGNGRPVRIHADQLETSPDGSLLYFQASSGPMYSVPTAALDDESLSADALKEKVKFFYDTPTTDGTVIDGDGNVYVSDVNKLKIIKIDPEGHESTLIADKRLVWADAMWIDSKGVLWIPAVQLNRTASFQKNGVSIVKRPVSIYTLDLHLKPVR